MASSEPRYPSADDRASLAPGSSSSIARRRAGKAAASWAAELYAESGDAFSIARRLGLLITHERLLAMSGPIGMRSHAIMSVAFRVMGNLVTPEDRDLVARTWRLAGRASLKIDRRRPFH